MGNRLTKICLFATGFLLMLPMNIAHAQSQINADNLQMIGTDPFAQMYLFEFKTSLPVIVTELKVEADFFKTQQDWHPISQPRNSDYKTLQYHLVGFPQETRSIFLPQKIIKVTATLQDIAGSSVTINRDFKIGDFRQQNWPSMLTAVNAPEATWPAYIPSNPQPGGLPPDKNPPGSDFPPSTTTPTTTEDKPEANVVSGTLSKILKTLRSADQSFPGSTTRYGFLLALPFFVLALILEIWYLIHRARPWGIVYDSQTKIPVQAALVRIFDKESNRLLETKTTDENGRFSLMVKPGKYFIEVHKQGYHFPSRLITSQDREYFPNVYRGELIESRGNAMVINVSIPIDSVQEKSAIEKTQTHWKLLLLYRWRRFIILMVTLIMFILFWLFRIPIVLLFILLLWLIEAAPRWKSIYGGNG